MTDSRVSRVATEALLTVPPARQVSRSNIDALVLPNPSRQVSRVAVEALVPWSLDGYAKAVLADSPWLYWGNPSRYPDMPNTADLVTMNQNTNKDGIFNGSAGVSYNGLGPTGLNNAWVIANANNFWRPNVSYGAQPTTVTYSCWVNVPTGALSIDAMVMTFTNITGGSGPTNGLVLTTAKKLRCLAYRSATENLESPNALTPGWHHCAVSVGAAGQKVYVDGVLVASDPTKTTTLSIANTTWPHVHAYWNGAGYSNSEPITASDFAFYPGVQLTDARIAAHYAAAGIKPAGPTVKYWDGTAMQPATARGWWDGSAIQPVTAKGWWDGSAIQPLS